MSANTIAGTYTVTATAPGATNNAGFTLTNTAGATQDTITMTSGTGQSETVNTAFTSPLVATVTDQFGNPVAGMSVTFAAPGSGASATFPGGITVLTGSNGQAIDPVSANTIAGSYSVTATAPGATNNAGFTLTNTAATTNDIITVTSGAGQSATVNSAFANALVATVTDSFGNLVSGMSVNFAAPGSGASGSFSNSSGGIAGTTNSAGQVSETFRANTVAGSYAVTATATGASSPANFTLTNTAQTTNDTIAVTSGSGQSATVNTVFTNVLVATVTDQFGNPVAGMSVNFAAPTSGASGSFSNSSGGIAGMTNSAGQLSESFSANTVAGSYTVAATATGATNAPASA